MKKLRPPSNMFAYLLISGTAHILYPVYQLNNILYSYLGSILVTAGVCLTIWAVLVFRKQNATVRSDEKLNKLVTIGPFRFSRNPMYLGMILVLFGAAFIMGSAAAFIGPLLFITSLEFVFVPEEEKLMEENFGTGFLEYKHSVRRWI